MADINDRIDDAAGALRGAPESRDSATPPGASADSTLLELVELLFFAYRDFTGEADEILEQFGFGRAHHRVLHFVNRHPGLRVADLLVILKITKQSLGRVLKQLVDQGYIAQKAGEADRRERLLYPTERGRALAERVAASQMQRIAGALDAAGSDTENTIRSFLYGMISEAERADVASLLASVGEKFGNRRNRA